MDLETSTNRDGLSSIKDMELIEDDYLPPRNNVLNIEKMDLFFKYIELVEDVVKKQSDQTDLYMINRKTSGNFSNDYVSEKFLKCYSIDKVSEFPSEEFLLNPDVKLKYGFVPEINRCWFYHQKTVYFWLFNDPKNVYTCYPIDETILKIFALPIQLDVNNRYSFLLILVAHSQLYVFSTVVQCNKETELNDFHVNVSNGIEITNLKNCFSSYCYTALGRAFLGGEDGHIYEVNYEIHEGIVKKCHLINVTAPGLLSLVPTVVTNLLSYSSLKQIVIDDHYNILYALYENNDINVYKLESPFEKLTKLDHITFSRIINQCASVFPRNFSLRAQSIVKICAVPDSESYFIQLLIITNNGFRIYVTSLSGDSNSQVTYCDRKYRCVHFRHPPFDDSIIQSLNQCSVYLSYENCIISIPYNNAYRVYCLNRTIRCNHELFQESLTIYSSNDPLCDISSSLIHHLLTPIPHVIKRCYNPKSRMSLLLQNLSPTNKYIGILSPTECLKITYNKPYQLLLLIIQSNDFKNSSEFTTFASRLTDIEFNSAYFTLLGKLDQTQKNLYDLVMKEIWGNSYMYEVNITKNAIFKRLLFHCNGSDNSKNDCILLHTDLPPLKFMEKNGFIKTRCFSFLFYTLLIHSYNYLMPIWNSRVLFKNEDSDRWDISINLLDCKYLRMRLEELLICVTRVMKYYKKILNKPAYSQLLLQTDTEMFDFSQDILLFEHLETIINHTYQWLHIWSGISLVDYLDFFQKSSLFDSLKTLTYSDLIFRNSQYTDRVIWKYLAFINYQPNNLQFFCTQWSKDAPLYFSSEYQQIIIANNHLLDAIVSQSPELKRNHVSSAVQIYNTLPKILDLNWISRRLIKLCYHPNAIALCLLAYNRWIELEHNCVPEEILFYRSIRIQLSNIIFVILKNSLENYEYICCKDGEINKNQKDVEFLSNNLKHTILAALAHNEDEGLSCDIYDWVIHNGYSYLLSECTSPYLMTYLKDINFSELSVHDLKKAKCLYDIYEKNKNFTSASEQLFKIAISHIPITSPDYFEHKLSIDDRADYLHLSLVHLSISSSTNETMTLTREIKSKLELFGVQKHILDEIEHTIKSNSHILQRPENVEELKLLKLSANRVSYNFISEQSLLYDIVIPCKLMTSYLLLLKKLGSKYIEDSYLIKTWNNLLYLALEMQNNEMTEESKNEAVKPFKELLLQYGSTSYCFPIDNLLFMFECRMANYSIGHLWLPKLLADANIITIEEYAKKIQTIINELFNNDLEKQPIIDALFYLFETYLSICTYILQDTTKIMFVQEMEVFNGYIEQKLKTVLVRNNDMINVKDKIRRIRDEILDFYQRASS